MLVPCSLLALPTAVPSAHAMGAAREIHFGPRRSPTLIARGHMEGIGVGYQVLDLLWDAHSRKIRRWRLTAGMLYRSHIG